MIPGHVLVGGASRRMGQPKALVRYQDVPLAQRAADTLHAGGCHPVSLVGKDPALGQMGYELLMEIHEGHHPLFGVATALTNTGGGLILVAPCDLIHLTIHSIRALLNHGGPCVASGSSRVHPLLAVLPCDWAQEALRLARDEAGAYELVRSLPRLVLPDRDLLDANYPRDLDTPR